MATTNAKSAKELVIEWCAGWPTIAADQFGRYFTDDARWINIPMPDQITVGPAAIAKMMAGFMRAFERVDIEVHHAAETDSGVVLVERTETFVFPGGTTFDLPVAAAFETRDGRIAEWRDYFDMKQFTSQLPAPDGT
jgi:limonene-1,2-epoxide hydrolase